MTNGDLPVEKIVEMNIFSLSAGDGYGRLTFEHLLKKLSCYKKN